MSNLFFKQRCKTLNERLKDCLIFWLFFLTVNGAAAEHNEYHLEGKGTNSDQTLLQDLNDAFGLVREPETVKLVKSAEQTGSAAEQFELGELYAYGYGPLEKNERLSIRWITKSASQGYYRAQRYLGLFYEEGGEVIPADSAKSTYWFGKLLESEFDPALALKLDKKAVEKPMQFVNFATCTGSGCRDAVLGIGVIHADSFLTLRKLQPYARQDLYLHSPGGSLAGGLRLGKEIRKLKLHTKVGGGYVALDTFGVLVEESVCASSCAYAFLGGLHRSVYEPRAFLLHQFSSQNGFVDESETQEFVALLNDYVDSMGVSRQMLDGALVTRPEKLTFFSLEDLWHYRVINSDPPEEIQGKVDQQSNRWQLEFDGEEPRVIMTRPTDYNTGHISVYLAKERSDTNGYQLSFRLLWSDDFEEAILDSAFSNLKDDSLTIRFCSRIDEHRGCDGVILSLSMAGSDWRQRGSHDWIVEYPFSSTQYEKLVAERPGSFIFESDEWDCGLANIHRDFRFCNHPYLLSDDFYRFVKLLKQ